jgi:hypothetical protein
MITKSQAIDIVEKFEFFQGQRAGRELWLTKSREVQDEDIKNFVRDCILLKEFLIGGVEINNEAFCS